MKFILEQIISTQVYNTDSANEDNKLFANVQTPFSDIIYKRYKLISHT